MNKAKLSISEIYDGKYLYLLEPPLQESVVIWSMNAFMEFHELVSRLPFNNHFTVMNENESLPLKQYIPG